VKLLVISPDYASHAFGLLEIASAASRRGDDVWFATGEAVRPLVVAAGLTWLPLRLGRGHNAGTIRVQDQVSGEDTHLRAFFDATRLGPAATLTYQAVSRQHDLLFEADRVLDDITAIVDTVQPDAVAVDHIAFGATLALYALDVPAASVVLGHPTALPAPGELYGLPRVWPDAVRPSPDEIDQLEQLSRTIADRFTAAANEVLARRAPQRPSLTDAFSRAGAVTLYNYPAELHDVDRVTPEGTVFLGSLARDQALGPVTLPRGDGPRVFVSLGSFLGARDDILRTAVTAASAGGWALALAHGATTPAQLGALPEGALIAPVLPQVALLDHADVAVTHGGNNTVTEALRAGVPLVVLPLSTDQFAGAASIEAAGVGVVLDPNRVTPAELVDAVESVRRPDVANRAVAIGRRLRLRPGAEIAVSALS
jgi:zeaxanthin glucosyltransferase